jgi:serine/threonine protein kinase
MSDTSLIISSSDDARGAAGAGERLVAIGSTSVCYTIRHHGKLLLKKQLREELRDKEPYRTAFRKEFEIGYNIDNENIVRYHEIVENGPDIYILMDYVDGKSLTEFIKSDPTYFHSAKNRRRFMEELLSAVGCLHRHQVLHLDLKPDNIMMTAIGSHVKLIDLGYCYQDSFPFAIGGTPKFSAPELFSHEFPLSAASDIYGIGQILHYLQIGQKNAIKKCLRENPRERFQTVEALRTTLLTTRAPHLKVGLPPFILLSALAIYEMVPPKANYAPLEPNDKKKSHVSTSLPNESAASGQKAANRLPATAPFGSTGRRAPLSSHNDKQLQPSAIPPHTATKNITKANTASPTKKSPKKANVPLGNYVDGLLITDTIGSDDPRNMNGNPKVLPNLSGINTSTGILVETTTGNWYVVTDPISQLGIRENGRQEKADKK